MRFAGLAICVGTMLAGVIWSTSRDDLPRLLVSASSLPPEISRCKECHGGLVARFESSGHNNTLKNPEGLTLKRFDGLSFTRTDERGTVRFVKNKGELWARSDVIPGSMQIDWVFGSGRHAQTPVSVLTGPNGRMELIEHAISWYPKAGLGVTLGQAESSVRQSGLLSFGTHHGGRAAEECFSCHASHLGSSENGLQPDEVIAGVGCVRCHIRAAEHLRTIGEGTTSLDSWSELSPIESINRCGECHRRADHFTADELVPENLNLVRFAPVGLSLSECFIHQSDRSFGSSNSQRLDCLTCHDPHATFPALPQAFREICLSCHTGLESASVVCSVRPSAVDCTSCHMPKIEIDKHISFTDHWIRVRESTKSLSP
jgi:predicted CXXCH cytochrome family protein